MQRASRHNYELESHDIVGEERPVINNGGTVLRRDLQCASTRGPKVDRAPALQQLVQLSARCCSIIFTTQFHAVSRKEASPPHEF